MNIEDKNDFLNDFGNWIGNQNPCNIGMDRINKKVYPKNLKSCGKISLDTGNFLEVKKDFLKNGGKVLKEEETGMILVEVKSGTFYINKNYIH